MLNRAAVVIRAKKPFIDWVQSLPGSADVDGQYIDQDSTIYLVPELTSDDETKEMNEIISSIYQHIFEEQLTDWVIDESQWPKNRDIKTFKKWFTIEYHSVVSDLVGDYLEDDEVVQFEDDD
ncbi:MAG TPA: hypothetical protein VLX29_11070 [Nitrospirota bacterium]|nr:hypothetical protein [Nitrospirota bacterium]